MAATKRLDISQKKTLPKDLLNSHGQTAGVKQPQEFVGFGHAAVYLNRLSVNTVDG